METRSSRVSECISCSCSAGEYLVPSLSNHVDINAHALLVMAPPDCILPSYPSVLLCCCAVHMLYTCCAKRNKHEQAHLSKSFVGLILLPIIGNAVEHITAITVAMKVRGMIGRDALN